MERILLEAVENDQLNFTARARVVFHGALLHFLDASRWQLFYLGVVCIMGVVGFVVSPYHSKTRLAFLLFGIAVYIATAALVDSPRRFWRAFGLLVIFGLAITLIGASGSTWTVYKAPAVRAITDHLPQAPALFLASLGAPDGIHPNQVAGMLTLYLPPLLGFVLFGGATAAFDGPVPRMRVLSWIALALLTLYLALSLSRAGLLATAVAALFLFWMRGRVWGLAALTALCAVLIGAYFSLPRSTLAAFLSNLFSSLNGTGETRTEIWRQAVQAIAAAPVIGIGLYNFRAIFRYNIYLPPGSTFIIVHAHNSFLQAALDIGLPGAIAYVLLLTSLALQTFRAGRRSTGGTAGACYGLCAATLAFGVFGLFDTIPLTSRVAWLTWFSLGLGAAAATIWGKTTGAELSQ